MRKIIHGQAFIEWLRLAGIVPERTQRVTIDASVGDLVYINVEMFGTQDMISVEPPLELKTTPASITILVRNDD